jgi:hypothetical protein
MPLQGGKGRLKQKQYVHSRCTFAGRQPVMDPFVLLRLRNIKTIRSAGFQED